ncbi:hypothetical protein AYI96_07610 [Shewanella sp. MSW]|nr:hypothetical protein AYI96_07610 [Shewanella sp. MSW]
MLSLQEEEVPALTAEQDIKCPGDKVFTWFVVTLVAVNKSYELLFSWKVGKKRVHRRLAWTGNENGWRVIV